MDKWYPALSQAVELSVLTKTLPTKGNLVYEYNPFRNYRLTQNMYEYDEQLHTEEDLKTKYNIEWDESAERWTKDGSYLVDSYAPTTRLKGELVDFVTDELSFDLSHPVHMIPQYSYDGSVNLILTDGTNQPRMINSRFSATGKNTYEIVDRKGSNDTNIYDQGEQFDVDTSLYKRVKQIPKLKLQRVNSGGDLKCGNYHFYFKLADADGNETDFVAESGLVSIFIGDTYPQSIYTGNKNENAVKQVLFKMTNIDPSYNYVYVYYSRATAEDGGNKILEYKKIDKKYLVNNLKEASILITGYEDTDDIAATEINLSYNIVDAANCATTAKSMLFLGNVHRPNIPYDELSDLSLRFLPYLKDERYDLDIDQEYSISSTSKGYYDPLYIYNKVGYWDKELYRIGIVYILSNGELSSVFNIRGREKISTFGTGQTLEDGTISSVYDQQYCRYLFTKEDTDESITIQSNESTNLVIQPSDDEGTIGNNLGNYENVKGVISVDSSDDTNIIHSLEIRVEPETITRLKNIGIKGFFFVRQTRIPTVLAQGITIGIDKEGRVPTIPTRGGVLDELATEVDGSTYVETKDITATNYVSEGFLSRYQFELKRKHSSLWSKIGKIALSAAAAVVVVAASIYLSPAGGAALASVLGSTVTAALGVELTAALVAVGTAVATASIIATTGAAIATAEEIANAINRSTHSKELKGRKTTIASGYYRSEVDDSRRLGMSFKKRLIIKDYSKNDIGAILCPDYDVAPQIYNQLFTGGDFVIKTTKSQATLQKFIDYYTSNQTLKLGYYFENDGRHFYMPQKVYSTSTAIKNYTSKLQAVPDDVSCVTIGSTKFRSKAGNSSEAWRYECIGDDYKQEPSYNSAEDDAEQSNSTSSLTDDQVQQELTDKEINSDIVRGSYGPYLGMTSYHGVVGETVQIMIPGYSDTLLNEYIQIRMQDSSAYYAITDRIDINDLDEYYIQHSGLVGDVSEDTSCSFNAYRGDCYICQFTHRLNRNFNDDSSPYNSDIVDSNSWKNHYKVQESEEFEKINLGDVNAVNLGMWVTFTVRSSRNLNVRSLDGSTVAEAAAMGHPRGFYPYHGMIAEGSYKSPEALVYNDGFTKSISERINFTQPDAPYIKNWFGTRIMYSDIHINDGFKNGYRIFQGQNYRDYTRQYGEIVKLLNYQDNLFVVFEHGLALIPVNERAVAAQGAGGNVYINTENVLPDTPNIISETFGSLWPDSVILTPPVTTSGGTSGARIFGVDTVAKKIWMYDGSSLKTISDFKVQEFLNQNLTLTERENTPILGVRNVKTAYNAFKHDVMFTFYDNLTGTEEKVWNLCYNLLLDKFITFYSWVPSFMENINNIPFSFDRNVSKWIAKLGQTHADNSFAEGIVLSNNIYNNDGTVDGAAYINYRYLNNTGGYSTKKFYVTNQDNLIGVFNIMDYILPEGNNIEYYVKFELMRDIYGYYKNFEVRCIGDIDLSSVKDAKYKTAIPIYGLFFKLGDNIVGSRASITDKEPVVTTSSNVSTDFAKNKNLYFSELFYRNKAGHSYNDYDNYKVTAQEIDPDNCTLTYQGKTTTLTLDNYFNIVHTLDLPIFHARNGIRATLDTPINKRNIVQLLNIKATIYARYSGSDSNQQTLAEFMNYLKAKESGTTEAIRDSEGWFNAGTYESSIAITSKWNEQFLDSSFWKHGQAGVIDNTEDILPTMWYGEQHPFEFECIVVNDPGVHKIFQNLELVANKAKPESFHFEIIGETYDFAKDKINMYYRQEARKALLQYNGCDITYNSDFLKLTPKQQSRSAELVHSYYERQDTMEDVYDNYVLKEDSNTRYIMTTPYYDSWAKLTPNKDYSHLSGAEIVYYPTRQEYRIWQHQPAIDIDDLSQDTATSIIRANCQYLEDRWRVSINPLLICYKNEYRRRFDSNGKPIISGVLCQPENSTWPNAMNADYTKSEAKLPPITIRNTCLPDAIKKAGQINFPNEKTLEGKDNALYGLYSWEGECPVDGTDWLSDCGVYKSAFGADQNRKETDLRDKFIKIRIRYSGEELAVIDFLNTIYTISYA